MARVAMIKQGLPMASRDSESEMAGQLGASLTPRVSRGPTQDPGEQNSGFLDIRALYAASAEHVMRRAQQARAQGQPPSYPQVQSYPHPQAVAPRPPAVMPPASSNPPIQYAQYVDVQPDDVNDFEEAQFVVPRQGSWLGSLMVVLSMSALGVVVVENVPAPPLLRAKAALESVATSVKTRVGGRVAPTQHVAASPQPVAGPTQPVAAQHLAATPSLVASPSTPVTSLPAAAPVAAAVAAPLEVKPQVAVAPAHAAATRGSHWHSKAPAAEPQPVAQHVAKAAAQPAAAADDDDDESPAPAPMKVASAPAKAAAPAPVKAAPEPEPEPVKAAPEPAKPPAPAAAESKGGSLEDLIRREVEAESKKHRQ